MARERHPIRSSSGLWRSGSGLGLKERGGLRGVVLLVLLVAAAGMATWLLARPDPGRVARAQGQPQLPTVTVRLVRLDPDWEGDAVLGEVVAEVADEPEEQRIGLMERTELASGQGMLFIWPTEQPVSMWMRSTRIPLDMVYATGLGQIVRITRDVPPCPDSEPNCPVYPSGAPVRYVLELPAGDAGRYGLKEGDFLLPGSR